MSKFIATLAFTILLGQALRAQERESIVPANAEKNAASVDTNSLLQAFRHGRIKGNLRYYFMRTDNREGLSDYYAHVVGGNIGYETTPFRGFRFGISGFLATNLASSDLTRLDPATQTPSRYELPLYNITDPSRKDGLHRLDELYLSYSWKKSMIRLGKQEIQTAFINRQDGRMTRTLAGGVYIEFQEIAHTKLEGGYLYQISPRSTEKWYSIANSIGLYPRGLNPDGTASGYRNALRSKGVFLLGITRQLDERWSVRAFDLLAENLFNALLVQADYRLKLNEQNSWLGGIQWIRQDALNKGGNDDPAKTYITPRSHAHSFGARWGWQGPHWSASINYNRITRAGRYLMPREWGRDPFFTFLPRERNEGVADVHAIVLKTGFSPANTGLTVDGGLGYIKMPDVKNAAYNKYGLPSYVQCNLDIHYQLPGAWKGVEAEFLYVYKAKAGRSNGNDKYIINRVDMQLWNLIINYRFSYSRH